MSKYSLEEIHKSNVREALSAEERDRFDQLSDNDQLKLEKIFAMMRAEKDAIEKDARKAKGMMEDFDSVVDKIKDSGKSEEDAKKIAGAINAKYVGNYREGIEENGEVDDYTEEIAEENSEDKLPMDEVRVDREVAERIEGMLSIPLKRKFLDAFMDLWQDLIEEDPFYAEDVINHLNNEMHREIDGYQAMGDKLAGIEIDENHAMQGVEAELESGEIGNMDALAEDDLEYTELDIDYLAADFLQDLLDIIQEVDELSKADKALTGEGIRGTAIGYDSDTQISSFVTDSDVKLIRQVEDKLEMKVSREGSYSIRIDQEGKINQVTVNGGSSSIINIKQGS